MLLDMDGTVVQYNSSSYQSSWDAIGKAAGLGEEWQELLRYYIDKPLLYQEWFDKNCEKLAGVSVAAISQEIFPPPYTPGFLECCGYLKQQGVVLGLLSSGVDLVAKRIQEEAGLDEIVVNEVYVENGCFTGRGNLKVALDGKGQIIQQLMEQYHAAREETAFIGDHFNDIPAWQKVGLPLGMNVKDARCYGFIQHHFNNFYEARDFLQGEIF